MLEYNPDVVIALGGGSAYVSTNASDCSDALTEKYSYIAKRNRNRGRRF